MRSRPFALLAILVAALGTANVARAEDLPRYHLVPGQVLHFQGIENSEYRYDFSGPIQNRYEIDTRITVLSAATGGGWNVVAISHLKLFGPPDEAIAPKSTTAPASQPAAKPTKLISERRIITSGILRPDGRVDFAKEPTVDILRRTLFPLPQTPTEATTGYTAPAQDDETYHITFHPDAKQPTLDATRTGTLRDIYQIDWHTTVTFDTARGLPIKYVSDTSSSWGLKETAHAVTTLESVDQVAPEAIAQFQKDLDLYTRTLETQHKTLDIVALAANPQRLDSAIQKCKDLLKPTFDQVQDPDLNADLKSEYDGLDHFAEFMKGELEDLYKVMNQPAPDVEFHTLKDNTPVHLKDFRGKVVVLDFWYRGCGWCVRAMPQIKQLAADYAGKDVLIVGVNNDEDLKDAQLVNDKLQFNYPVWHVSHDAPSRFAVYAFPSVVIIDRKGIVRGFDEGWSPGLRKELAGKIDPLLPKP